MSGLVERQLEAGRKVILEGRASDVPVRDEVFENHRRLGQLLGEAQHQWWCHLGIANDKGRTVCGDHLVLSSPPWQGGSCVCNRHSATYAFNKGEGYDEFILHALLNLHIIPPQSTKCKDHKSTKSASE